MLAQPVPLLVRCSPAIESAQISVSFSVRCFFSCSIRPPPFRLLEFLHDSIARANTAHPKCSRVLLLYRRSYLQVVVLESSDTSQRGSANPDALSKAKCANEFSFFQVHVLFVCCRVEQLHVVEESIRNRMEGNVDL